MLCYISPKVFLLLTPAWLALLIPEKSSRGQKSSPKGIEKPTTQGIITKSRGYLSKTLEWKKSKR